MDLQRESRRCLQRIVTSLNPDIVEHALWRDFLQRLSSQFPVLFERYIELYGQKYDCYFHLQNLVISLFENFQRRKGDLKRLDAIRSEKRDWFREESLVGMACYVDLFSTNLQGLTEKVPYFRELGVNYVHLMPLFKTPDGESDGGYAVSSYREVNPSLGSIDELREVADVFHENGMVLVLDFVFNHTANDHLWAQRAKQGDGEFQKFYFMYDDKTEPDKYAPYLREIFPQIRRGSFTWEEDIKKWIWTTFNSFQWDLNYSNPEVFSAVTEEMLFLANVGCDVLRLDALAFTWKEMGTDCENLPKAHSLIQLFKVCLSIVAPSVLFKSEAIVHPDEVNKYIDTDECQLSYNPLLMALLWNSLATRKTRLLTSSMLKSFSIGSRCSWVNYVRCHDDIGWTFDDKVASELGINGFDHRKFLNTFYKGDFPGSFSNGVAFGENPDNQDCRIAGTLASLCGLEQALTQNNEYAINQAARRIMLLHSIVLSIGGIPLLYYGDELAITNDYSYLTDEDKRHDARWVNRPLVKPEHYAVASSPGNIQQQLNQRLKNLISIRKNEPILGRGETIIVAQDNIHLFVYRRQIENAKQILIVCNFSDSEQCIKHLTQDKSLQLIAASEVPKVSNEYGKIEALGFYWFIEITS